MLAAMAATTATRYVAYRRKPALTRAKYIQNVPVWTPGTKRPALAIPSRTPQPPSSAPPNLASARPGVRSIFARLPCVRRACPLGVRGVAGSLLLCGVGQGEGSVSDEHPVEEPGPAA